MSKKTMSKISDELVGTMKDAAPNPKRKKTSSKVNTTCTYFDYKNNCDIIETCSCDPDCDDCKQGTASIEAFEGMILTAALYGDMETIVNAGGAKPERLLTWKERNRNDNIELDAGKFSILTQEEATEFGRPQVFSFMSFFKNEYLSRDTDQESAKRLCEQHARTLLGWNA